MSRLPTLSTPGRVSTSSPSGLPTPSATGRRPRSSLTAPAFPSAAGVDDDPDAALQLQEALRNRPPSSVKNHRGLAGLRPAGEDDPDTPTSADQLSKASRSSMAGAGVLGRSQGPKGLGLGVPPGPIAPRTPSSAPASARARPSLGGLGMGHPTTPSASASASASGSRSVSRASVSTSTSHGRPSLGGGSSFVTPRRPSMATAVSATTSTTPLPAHRRTESRQSSAHMAVAEAYWTPTVDEKVRIGSMGFEGTLRFLGEVQFRAGVWAGVELEGGFAGKGKNDGSVDGVQYFTCPPDCGVFVMASRLSAPTADASRPASVASHRSHTSQLSASGRTTPALASSSRPATTTPHRAARVVSGSVRGAAGRPSLSLMRDDEAEGEPVPARPVRTLLGVSTSSNVNTTASAAPGKITAGSRASKYVGMTAKQLEQTRAGTGSRLGMSTSTSTSTTPRASRVSMGGAGAGITPARAPRQSLGMGTGASGFVTPRPGARGPRASAVGAASTDMMPPPPSPSNINKIIHERAERMEEEIRELKRRNAELEAEMVAGLPARLGADEDEGERRAEAGRIREELEAAQQEANELRHQLSASHADAADATRLAEELEAQFAATRGEAEARQQELSELKKEMRLVEERAQGELQAGFEANERQVAEVLERAELAEAEGAEMRALVEELTQAGQATISLYETKQYDFEDRVRALEEKNRSLEDKLSKARESAEQAQLNGTGAAGRDPTAAEIDNETLQAQLAHLQTKIGHLEEELEEVRVQADKDEELLRGKVTKAREGERVALESVKELKGSMKRMEEQAAGAKSRVTELEGALKENRVALEGARAEIEGLRGEAGEVRGLKEALGRAEGWEKELVAKKEELRVLTVEVEQLRGAEERSKDAGGKVEALQKELDEVKQAASKAQQEALSAATPAKSSRLSTGPEDLQNKLRGFQHIIDDLAAENAGLKDKLQAHADEMALLKEEVRLLEETNELSGSEAGPKDSTRTAELEQTVKELNRELAELESLVEAKIYREDELEREVEKWKGRVASAAAAQSQAQDGARSVSGRSARSVLSAHSAHSSIASRSDVDGADSVHGRANGDAQDGGKARASSDERCELCEGPHELDQCPVFAGDVSAGALGGDKEKSPLAGKGQKGAGAGGKYCQDCESTEHDTAECPLAEDVF